MCEPQSPDDRATLRESFKRDALHAWEHYQRTGLYVTFEDADAWMASLGSKSEHPITPLVRCTNI
jgi:predicted transcriptional regulator